jgi:hypothetical protein
MRFLVISGVLACVSFPAFSAGITEAACLRSERSPGREVCACAQYVADRMLSRSDQQNAAKIIAEPDKYLEFKYASSRKEQGFLDRYRAWGEASAEYCTR